jgi:lipopolysaccharide export system permease protein
VDIRFSLYTQKYAFAYLCICFFIIWLIVIVSQTVKISKILSYTGLGIENIFTPLSLSILPYFSFIFSIAVLISISLTVVKLCSDQEFITFLSCGCSFFKFLNIFFVFIVFSISIFVVSSFYIESWGREKIKSFLQIRTKTKLDTMLKSSIHPRVVNKFFPGYTFYTDKINQDKMMYYSVSIAPSGSDTYLKYFLTAEKVWFKGSFEQENIRIYFKNANIHSYNEDEDKFVITNFENLDLDVMKFFFKQALPQYRADKDVKSFNIEHLYKELNFPSDKRSDIENKRIAYLFYSKISNILLIISFILLGIIFGTINPRQHKNFCIIKCVSAVILIYFFVHLFSWLTELGYVPLIFGSFFAQAIVFIISVSLYWRRSVIPLWDKLLY